MIKFWEKVKTFSIRQGLKEFTGHPPLPGSYWKWSSIKTGKKLKQENAWYSGKWNQTQRRGKAREGPGGG